ncbi:MAG: hypothetical protein ACE5GY_01980 [Thermodesulfobacteriota bacterium]
MPKNRLLERDFKLKFGLKLCLLTIAGMAAVTLLLYSMTSRTLGGTYAEAIYTLYDLKIRIFPLIFASSYSIFILAVVTAAIAAISVLFSHKIAGPLFRVEKNLEVIGSGDLTVQTRFRGNDQLVALADEINEMSRSLNHTVRSTGDALALIEKGERTLRELLEDGGIERQEALAAAAELKAGVEEFKRALSTIKTDE